MYSGQREVSYSASADDAYTDVMQAAMDAGDVLDMSERTRTITVAMRYGLQRIKLRVSVKPAPNRESIIHLHATRADLFGFAARKVIDNFIHVLENVEEEFDPD